MSNAKATASLNTPFDDPCSCFYMRRAARMLTRQYAETMKAAGLKSSQFSILSILSHHGQLTISELAEKMGLERTSLSRNLRPMEKDGLISISDELEKRRRYIQLSSQGKAAYKKALPLWNKAQLQFQEQMGVQELKKLKTLLKRTAEVTNQ